MKTTSQRIATRFGPEAGFEVNPSPAAPFRATEETELERLKSRLLHERLARVSQPDINVRLRRAANDAAALAWVTAFPLLVFPGLFEEKAWASVQQARRQDGVLNRSRELLAA